MGGYFAYLSFEREQIREAVIHNLSGTLDKSDLICIVANAQNLAKIEWERPEKEFSFEGNFYDVVSVEVRDGLTYYYCFNDQAETRLAKKIDQYLALTGNCPDNNNGTSKLLLQVLYEPLILQTKPSFCFKSSLSYSLIVIYARKAWLPAKGYLAQIDRPPDFIFS